MPSLHLVPADSLEPTALHAAFRLAFADYLLGPFEVPLEGWTPFLARQAVDLSQSRAALVDGEIVSFCLVAPREDGSSWRLGTMGALPPARGSGAAGLLLEDFIARARAAGRQRVELECFAQNERALRLYARFGFEPLHDLWGYEGLPRRLGWSAAQPQHASDSAGVAPQPIEVAFAAIDAFSRRDGALPLQVTPQSLSSLPVQLQAWRCGDAFLVASETGDDKLTVHALLDASEAQDAAEALVQHVMGRYGERALHVPQLQRDDLGGAALLRLGLQRLPLHQRLMRLALSRP